jgi:carbon monoxide dehydrogenase subunit G
MKIKNQFRVPLPVADAWVVLNDIPRVAHCAPGTELVEARPDGSYIGTVRVKLGPISLSFRGTLVYQERDETSHRVVAEASGNEERARGTARDLVVFVLSPEGNETRVEIFGFIYFALLNTGIPWVIFVTIAISLVPVMTQYGPEAALIAESFSPRLRYSGTSIGYQLASIIAGGPAPIIATWLFATFHSSVPIALYILLLAIIGIIATSMLTDYTNKDISAEYAGV